MIIFYLTLVKLRTQPAPRCQPRQSRFPPSRTSSLPTSPQTTPLSSHSLNSGASTSMSILPTSTTATLALVKAAGSMTQRASSKATSVSAARRTTSSNQAARRGMQSSKGRSRAFLKDGKSSLYFHSIVLHSCFHTRDVVAPLVIGVSCSAYKRFDFKEEADSVYQNARMQGNTEIRPY